MSVEKFFVGTDDGSIHIEVQIDTVHIYASQFTSEGASAELVLYPDEARELARMLNLIATVAEGNK